VVAKRSLGSEGPTAAGSTPDVPIVCKGHAGVNGEGLDLVLAAYESTEPFVDGPDMIFEVLVLRICFVTVLVRAGKLLSNFEGYFMVDFNMLLEAGLALERLRAMGTSWWVDLAKVGLVFIVRHKAERLHGRERFVGPCVSGCMVQTLGWSYAHVAKVARARMVFCNVCVEGVLGLIGRTALLACLHIDVGAWVGLPLQVLRCDVGTQRLVLTE